MRLVAIDQVVCGQVVQPGHVVKVDAASTTRNRIVSAVIHNDVVGQGTEVVLQSLGIIQRFVDVDAAAAIEQSVAGNGARDRASGPLHNHSLNGRASARRHNVVLNDGADAEVIDGVSRDATVGVWAGAGVTGDSPDYVVLDYRIYRLPADAGCLSTAHVHNSELCTSEDVEIVEVAIQKTDARCASGNLNTKILPSGGRGHVEPVHIYE